MAPTLAPLGINREHDSVWVPECVGVKINAQAPWNSIGEDTVDLALAPVKGTDQVQTSTPLGGPSVGDELEGLVKPAVIVPQNVWTEEVAEWSSGEWDGSTSGTRNGPQVSTKSGSALNGVTIGQNVDLLISMPNMTGWYTLKTAHMKAALDKLFRSVGVEPGGAHANFVLYGEGWPAVSDVRSQKSEENGQTVIWHRDLEGYASTDEIRNANGLHQVAEGTISLDGWAPGKTVYAEWWGCGAVANTIGEQDTQAPELGALHPLRLGPIPPA